MRKLWLVVVLGWFIPITTFALWAEPSCDPAVDPTTCNISAPLNVSSSDQTKDGGLIIGGSLMVNGLTTLDTLIVNGVSSTFNSLAIFNNGINIANTFNYAGPAINFVVTADSIDDLEVSNTLTASIFQSGGATPAVDLNSMEVAGVLPSSSVTDVWVNTAGDTMTGALNITPTTLVDALSIAPNSTRKAIFITGATNQALVELDPTGSTGIGLNINMTTGSADGIVVTAQSTFTGRGIYVSSTTGGIPVFATASSAYKTIYAENSATSGSAIQAIANGTTSVGVAASGTSYGLYSASLNGIGVYGSSGTGYGGYIRSGTTSGSALYAALTSNTTTTSSKALEVVGKNGYGGYFTADGDQSTALYAENTDTTYGFSNYAIYATTAPLSSATTIYAEADYGTAGQFVSSNGGTALHASNDTGIGVDVITTTGTGVEINTLDVSATGISVNTVGNGIDVSVSADVGVGLLVNVPDFGRAIETNSGAIHNEGSYEGGQFYPNEQTSSAISANQKITTMSSTTLNDGVSDMLFDGDTLWIGYNATATAYANYTQNSLRDGHQIDTASTTYPDSLEVDMVGDTIYFFTDSATYFTKNRYDGNESNGSLSSSITINSSTFDGEDVWFGTGSRIYQWDGLSILTSRVSGLGSIVDMIYADSYLWAVDSTNDLVYKVDTSTYSYSSITVGDNPQAIVYDGQFLWVANYGGNSLTRINVADSSAKSLSVLSGGNNPQALTYDGINVWIGYDNLDGVAAFNVAQESITKSNSLSGASVASLVFDGTYIWVATESNDLIQISTGTGWGGKIDPIVDGILMYNTSGAVRCIYVNGTTLTASPTLTNCQN